MYGFLFLKYFIDEETKVQRSAQDLEPGIELN